MSELEEAFAWMAELQSTAKFTPDFHLVRYGDGHWVLQFSLQHRDGFISRRTVWKKTPEATFVEAHKQWKERTT